MIKWLDLWNQKAETDNFLTQTGRGNSFNLTKFLLYMIDLNNALQLERSDVLLDIGGGSGWITLWLSPFVDSIVMFDYSDKMIEIAWRLTDGCTNTSVFTDNILSMKKVQGTYNKILVGSVLQYLNNMDEVRTALRNIYNVMEPGGKVLFTHNPDLSKKTAHIASVPQTVESLRMENERLWLDKGKMVFLALKDVGFAQCSFPQINPAIWQSTHMFDLLLVK
jgi:protein-L-isoaspartate O-methyltransferase